MNKKLTMVVGAAASALVFLGATHSIRSPFLHSRKDPLPGFPALMLWAWEEPQDLRFIDPARVGVAYLAETLIIGTGWTVVCRPRVQPLRVAPGTKMMAVVRIENKSSATFDPDLLAASILHRHVLVGASALQVDYDAVRSGRAAYADLLRTLRRRMPPEMPLTITALLSWCNGDNWIDELPVADAIPMYFRMGVERHLVTVRPKAWACQ